MKNKNYNAIYNNWLDSPEQFWAEQAAAISWDKPWDYILDTDHAPHFYRWFKGGQLNTCYNAVDRHVEAGHGDRTAIIYDSAMTGDQHSYSYKELQHKVSCFAGGLQQEGLVKGDRVIIYMPMISESLIAILACARLGLVHSVVFGGFAANELATRIIDAEPKAIITATCGIEPSRIIAYMPLVHEAIILANNSVQTVIIAQRPEQPYNRCDGELDFDELIAHNNPVPCVSVDANDPLYILYTSGTTGKPKGVVRDNGGHAVALHWSMNNIYNIQPGEVFWSASDIGWIVGHSYIIYAPLLYGATTLMYEGKPVGTPDAGAFWRVVEQYKVVSLFTAPTAFRAIKKEDPDGILMHNYDLSHFRALFLAGERCDPDTLEWAQQKLNVPVIDHWWQTETAWSIAANPLGIEPLPIKVGSPTRAMPGYDIRILDDNQQEVPYGDMGSICIKLPLPPSCLLTLWNADQRFIDSYLSAFPGYYQTGDAGYMDDDGYIYVMSRTDDIINVAGHRLSTGGMEEVLASHNAVAECAVIGAKDALKGEVPLGFIVLKAGVSDANADIVNEVVKLVRVKIGAVAVFKSCVVVERLPKTRSGKILRAIMRKVANGDDYNIPPTIDDATILDDIETALKNIGYAQK